MVQPRSTSPAGRGRWRIALAASAVLLLSAVLPAARAVASDAATYVVQPGDTLSGIADALGVTPEALAEANGLSSPDVIVAGQVLTVPRARVAAAAAPASAARTHTVKAGESLSGIADLYGITPEALAQANGIDSPDLIVEGQVLVVPGAAAVTELPATGRTHTVQAGESLSTIADGYGLDPDALAAYNGITDANLIAEGQILRIPAASRAARTAPARTHTVTEGETLSAIAVRFNVSVQAIVDANGLADASRIVIGQSLVIPAGALPPYVTHGEARQAVYDAAIEFGIEPALLLALAWQESGFQMHLVSEVGAIGIMQVLPETGDWAAAELLSGAGGWQVSARDNARVGAAVFRHLLDVSGGDVRLSIAAYYQGWGSIERNGWFDETHAYVSNVLALVAEFR